MEINKAPLVPLAELSSSPEDEPDLLQLSEIAKNFLLLHAWCGEITAGFLGYGWEGILGIFFFEIEPSREGVDRQLWVIVGDVPPAYLVCDDAPRASDALRGYISHMRLWVDAVHRGESTRKLIPVCYRNTNRPIEPTQDFAEMLAGRLDFIEDELLPEAVSEGA